MKIYLVGGAVRNQLLQLPVKDRDWVVVGATPAELLTLGFQQVGRDFPVFLHPHTKEEYALARTERKSGVGYKGFDFHVHPQITLEEDLQRRDLTINAIAQDEHGTLHDPFDGQGDLKKRLLRHVSPAFSEDPLRVLRVARFAAELQPLGFQVAPETFALMSSLADTDELSSLTPERVWMETEKALKSPAPFDYFQILQRCHALKSLFPQLADLFHQRWRSGDESPHEEITTGEFTLTALRHLCHMSADPILRFALICHAIGSTDHSSATLLSEQLTQMKVPTEYKKEAQHYHGLYWTIIRPHRRKANAVLDLFQALSIWREPERWEDLKKMVKALSYPLPRQECEETIAQLDACFRDSSQITAQTMIQLGYQGKAISEELYQRRLACIEAIWLNHESSHL